MTTESTYYSAHVYDNSLAITRTRENTAPVVAAGALVWRLHGEKLEVLMIHRPRYNDWSWPKGKQDAGAHSPGRHYAACQGEPAV